MTQTKAELKAQGKRNKAAGARFEKKTREHMEEDGWVVTKFRCNIENGQIIPARNYYIPGRGNVMGSGFPDFVMFREKEVSELGPLYEVIFLEAKINGFLSKEEKEKCKVLIKMGHKVMIAYEDKSQQNNIRIREFFYNEGKEKIPRG